MVAVTATSIVTLPSVRNKSGTVSTATSSPSASIGTPIATDTGATEAKKLLEWGFRNFETRTLFAAQEPVGSAKVFGGDRRWIRLVTAEPVRVMVQKNGNDKLIARVVYQGPVHAPIEPGQKIGSVKVWRNGSVAVEEPLYASGAVGVGTTMQRAFDGASELMIGVLRAGVEKL